MRVYRVEEAEEMGLHRIEGLFHSNPADAEAEYNRECEAYPKAKIVVVDTLTYWVLYGDYAYDLYSSFTEYTKHIDFHYKNIIQAKIDCDNIVRENEAEMNNYQNILKEIIKKINRLE